jgi:outer membrane protein assembly factor BamB
MRSRERLLFAFFCISAGMLTTICLAAGTLRSPHSWTQFRLNADNDAAIPGTLQVSWHIRTNGAFSSSPALVGTTLYIGNNAGTLYAIDVLTGRVLWTYHVHNPIMSAPIVYGDAVIVAEGNENSPTNSTPARPIHVGAGPNAIVALRRENGTLLWRRALGGTGMPTPAIVDGILVHHDGAGDVVGLDPQTGALRYERNLHSIASMVAALPVWGNRWITAGEWENAVWELRADDGSVIWKTHFSSVASGLGDCPPVSDAGRIYCDYIMPPSSATPVVVGDAAQERAYAIDVATGKRVWDVAIDAGHVPPRNEAAIPLLADGTLYMGSSMESLMSAVDPRTGRIRWQARTHGPVLGGAVYADGRIYFGDLAGYLWALDAKTGRLVGDYNAGTPFNVGSPLVAGQTLIVGSRGGQILAVPLATIRDTHAS